MRISWRELGKGAQIPRWHGFSHSDFKCGVDVFYPVPINWLVRYSVRIYWRVLRAFDWVGLIDKADNEVFHWDSFYRIKL